MLREKEEEEEMLRNDVENGAFFSLNGNMETYSNVFVFLSGEEGKGVIIFLYMELEMGNYVLR